MTREGLLRWRAAVEHDGDQQHVVQIIDSHLEALDRYTTSVEETIGEIRARSELGQVLFAEIKATRRLSQEIIDIIHGVALVIDQDRLLVGVDYQLWAALPEQPGGSE